MPRNMSFSMTTDQFKARTKTVTRRLGWWFLKPGDIVQGVEKCMGLKAGEKVKPLGLIRVVSVRAEPLDHITQDDVVREGFPEWSRATFVGLLTMHYRVWPNEIVNRIEFEYIEENKP